MEDIITLQEDIISFLVKEMNLHIETLDTDIILNNAIDSINFVNMVITLEARYSIEFPDEFLLLSELNTVAKISQIIFNEKYNYNNHVCAGEGVIA